MFKKLYIGFLTIFLCMLTLTITLLSYFEYINMQILMSNSLMSNKAISIALLNGDVITKENLKDIIRTNSEITIYTKVYATKELSVFGFCGNTNINVNSFIKGRFFKEEDFFSSKNIAVVGEKVTVLQLNELTKGNYKIIGKITPSTSPMLENTAFINLDSLDIERIDQFIIDSKTPGSISNFLDVIKKDSDIHVYNKNNNFIERFLYNDMDLQKIVVYSIILILLLTILLTTFIIRYYNKEIKVKKIIGIKFGYIYLDLLKSNFILIFTTTLIFIAGYSFLYYKFLFEMHLTYYLFKTISFSTVIFFAINVIIYFYLTMQKLNHKL